MSVADHYLGNVGRQDFDDSLAHSAEMPGPLPVCGFWLWVKSLWRAAWTSKAKN
jgi:hypothetical protein